MDVYALVTQQTLRGRATKGGQWVGEMEIWALEGLGVYETPSLSLHTLERTVLFLIERDFIYIIKLGTFLSTQTFLVHPNIPHLSDCLQ